MTLPIEESTLPSAQSSVFDERDEYIFDSVGFLVKQKVFSEAFCGRLLNLIKQDAGAIEAAKISILDIHRLFLSAAVHPFIVSACSKLIGPQFRLDHAFALRQPAEDMKPNLHGGPYSSQGAAFYWGPVSARGQIRCGRLTVGIALSPQAPGTGGFAYIPGSHRSSFELAGREVLDRILGGNLQQYPVVVPELTPGDVYLFPDCLVHGASAWAQAARRTALYYAFTPGYMTWRGSNETPRLKDDLPLFEPAYVAKYEVTGLALGENQWRRAVDSSLLESWATNYHPETLQDQNSDR
jgi:hypothetical protein